ncbi:hypothetical protein C1W78_25065 [Burkholderia pseudomallei]|uniref:Uncharacterized protein n=1 Tax=Burkholderia pseudomallei TaxID=28450 RepID=A0AAX0U8V2_BURPE|nr:hypothetical protein EGY15_29590 [Burkholderia pseudomallei]MUU86138.1 hypothetical protein [Burkholderia pseudomallei]NAY09356.1 hypothetical protein [Burkholderia pseudomallei]NAY15520.1 hypothetical protein [Burkholderia pseudomallei]NAY41274.1 hypothetical protein [Burkholderia pseudomallei]
MRDRRDPQRCRRAGAAIPGFDRVPRASSRRPPAADAPLGTGQPGGAEHALRGATPALRAPSDGYRRHVDRRRPFPRRLRPPRQPIRRRQAGARRLTTHRARIGEMSPRPIQHRVLRRRSAAHGPRTARIVAARSNTRTAGRRAWRAMHAMYATHPMPRCAGGHSADRDETQAGPPRRARHACRRHRARRDEHG